MLELEDTSRVRDCTYPLRAAPDVPSSGPTAGPKSVGCTAHPHRFPHKLWREVGQAGITQGVNIPKSGIKSVTYGCEGLQITKLLIQSMNHGRENQALKLNRIK